MIQFTRRIGKVIYRVITVMIILVVISILAFQISGGYPTFQSLAMSTKPSTKISIPPTDCRGYVALSYDDGPTAGSTLERLKMLNAYNLHATFFVVGEHVSLSPELAKDIVKYGNAIENHTWDHPDLRKLTLQQVQDELVKAENEIRSTTGVTATLFRPPYGDTQPDIAKQVGSSLNLTEVGWTLDTNDWEHPSTAAILKSLSTIKAGDIVLMHDSSPQTIQAIPSIASLLQSKNLCTGRIVKSTTPVQVWDGWSYKASVVKW